MRWLVRFIDARLRKSGGVYEFTSDPRCVLRLGIEVARQTYELPDVTVNKGEPVLNFHLWNEHVPLIDPDGSDMAWALRMTRVFVHSLRMVAAEIERDPRLKEVRAVGAATTVFGPSAEDSGNRVFTKLGFTITPYRHPLGRFAEFWENLYGYALMWTYNAASLHTREFLRLRRSNLWMSRREFLERYGPAGTGWARRRSERKEPANGPSV